MSGFKGRAGEISTHRAGQFRGTKVPRSANEDGYSRRTQMQPGLCGSRLANLDSDIGRLKHFPSRTNTQSVHQI